MKPKRPKTAQELCTELFTEIEAPLSDAWVSDEAGPTTPEEYVSLIQGHLLALEEARTIMKRFLRRHRALTTPK